jgi:hypothetical protein
VEAPSRRVEASALKLTVHGARCTTTVAEDNAPTVATYVCGPPVTMLTVTTHVLPVVHVFNVVPVVWSRIAIVLNEPCTVASVTTVNVADCPASTVVRFAVKTMLAGDTTEPAAADPAGTATIVPANNAPTTRAPIHERADDNARGKRGTSKPIVT